MGFLSEYIGKSMTFDQITTERKAQLSALSAARGGRDVLVYAADLMKQGPPIGVDYSDLQPIADQLANLHGQAIDVVLETPGGAGEVAEDIVRMLHDKYQTVAFIIPGWAKSAGTIMAMAGNEILMGSTSALGPIDAQNVWQGKQFSADAFLEGLEKIKKETVKAGALNRAYIPILQGISPGEIQAAQNAMKFSEVLARDWLAKYKFKDWTVHSTTGQPVTAQQRRGRARQIARVLCNHRRWLTHGKSLRIADLQEMGLKITNYETLASCAEPIARYHALLLMTFQTTVDRNIYKVFETPNSQVYRQAVLAQAPAANPAAGAVKAAFDFKCPSCGTDHKIQANLAPGQTLDPGNVAFPPDNQFKCPVCGTVGDLSPHRAQIEAQTGKKVVP